MKQLNALCAVLVEAVVLSVFALVVLSFFSAATTRHLVISQTVDQERAILSGDTSGIHVGQRLLLYRFNPDWKLPIGEATVERISSSGAEISVDAKKMRWPLGRHGTVVREDDEWVVSIGSRLGFKKGDAVSVFRGRENLGLATITSVENDTSTLELPLGLKEASSLVVSEYRFATQAAWQSSSFSIVEGFIIVIFFAMYVSWYVYKRQSPLRALGEYLRGMRLPQAVRFWPVNIVAIVPFAWFMAKMPLYLGAHLIELLSGYAGETIRLEQLADTLFPYAFGVLLAVSYGFLLWKRRSPILAFWRILSYKKPSAVQKLSWKRGLVLWALHLIIVYVFGWTLISFLVGDIAAARAIGPNPGSLAELADFWKYVIWALTVVGVLFGYGYSVVSILWGRFIRNLDFTITGWLTNGFCYPFLGVVIWQMVPSFTGPGPIITSGPLALFALLLGFLLNLLYMLSIWNLGTMFDLMADKGVRTSLFYSAIRHPNYMLEAMMFFVTELVGLSSGLSWLGISVYFFLYWIRSEREDNFMWYSNPAYAEYQKATPYKFIPGIY